MVVGKVIEIELDKLTSLGNVRRIKREDPELIDLARSMDLDGQEVEIRVYPIGDGRYAISKGHRRFAAAKINGWSTIRAVVIDPPEDVASHLVSQYNENERRQGLTYLEKAWVYKQLRTLGWRQKDIAERFGASDSDVSLALAALRADPKLQRAIEDGRIKPSAVEPLLSQPAEVQAELADAAIAARTVRGVSQLVKAHLRRKEIFETQRDEDAGEENYLLPDESGPDEEEFVDPLEEMAVDELDEALKHARLAAQSKIRHPELVRTALPKVEELLRMAASLHQQMTGDT